MATQEETKLVNQLAAKLSGTQGRIDDNLSYYEATHLPRIIGLSTPPQLRDLMISVGWVRMYLDSLEERLDVEGFRMSGETESDERMWTWWQSNNMDVESGLAHLESFIHGISYVTVGAPDPDDMWADQDSPVIRVESPRNMYAKFDPVTRQPTMGIRIYRDEEFPKLDKAVLYLPNKTMYLERSKGVGGWTEWRPAVVHNLGRPTFVAMPNRESLSCREGQSEIFREIRDTCDAAARTLMNMSVAAELMAVPQRVLMGVSAADFAVDPTNPGASWKTYLANILALENEAAKIDQFAAAELRNYTEALDQFAKNVASYTGLPPQYLSFSSDNPASADAIRASESRLIKKAERKTRIFGAAWEEVMRLCMLVMDGEIPTEAFRLESVWRDPATPTYAAKADAVAKLYANGMGVIPQQQAWVDLGYSEEQRKQLAIWAEQNPTAQLNQLLLQSEIQNNQTQGNNTQEETDNNESGE